MNRKFLYTLFIVSLLFTSCMTYLDGDMSFTPKLVLFCRLAPQMDTTILHLSHTVPVFSDAPKTIKGVTNAVVEISDDNQRWVKMEYSPEMKYYFIPQAQFSVKEGKTYYVKASASGYEEVSSSCTVPFFRETNLKMTYEKSGPDTHDGNEYKEPHVHAFLEWKDFSGEENYYQFFIENSLNYYDEETGELVEVNEWYSLGDFDDNVWTFSDKGKDGKKISVLLFIMDEIYPLDFDITMVQMDKHCYLFETTIRSDRFSMEDFLSVFILEPYQVYSNINNGFGLFGAFVMREYSLE